MIRFGGRPPTAVTQSEEVPVEATATMALARAASGGDTRAPFDLAFGVR